MQMCTVHPPQQRAKTQYIKRSFTIYGSHLWNNLPEFLKYCPTLETFKSAYLRHFFFTLEIKIIDMYLCFTLQIKIIDLFYFDVCRYFMYICI